MGLLNQIAVNSLYRFLFLILQFLITISISRLTGPDGLGTYSLILANASIILIFTSLGIPSGVTFHSAKKDISEGKLVRIAFISAALQLALIGFVEFVHWLMYGQFLIWPVKDPLPGISGIIFFFSLLITERYAALYNGNNLLHWYNLQAAFFSLLTMLPMIYWMLSAESPLQENVILMIILMGILQVVSLAIFYSRLPVPITMPALGEMAERPRFFNYSMLSWISNSFQFLVYRIDFWILHYFHGENELGLYALSVRIGQTFWIMPGLLAAVILPHITSVNFDRGILERIIRITNTVNLAAAILIIFLALPVIPFIFGDAFEGSVFPLMILVPGVLFVSMHTLLAAYFAGRNKISYNLKTSVMALVIITLLDFLMIPGMGKVGAALASTIAYTTSSIYAMILYSKMEQYPLRRLLMEKQDMIWLENNLFKMISTRKT
jgi:O-antigen/teichoic acid export membrane protein